MKEHENIYAFLKEGVQKTRLGAIGSRIDRTIEQKTELARLLDMEKMEAIQVAVDQRMGPMMCDNSEREGKEFKEGFREVLKGYKMEIKMKMREEKARVELAAVQIEERLTQLEDKFIKTKEESRKRVEQKRRSATAIIRESHSNLSQTEPFQVIKDIQKQIQLLECEVDIKMLQSQLLQRNKSGEVRSILRTLHLKL